MKKNNVKIITNFLFSIMLVSILFINCNVKAATTLRTYSFSGTAGTFGGTYLDLQYLQGISADYVKVTVSTSGGDEYDLRLAYTSTFPSERRILAQKTKITAKGSSYTFYFIPQNGSCPSSNSARCITVPVVSQISSSNEAVLDYDVMYGIEIHNRSWLGGTLSFDVTYSFMNY